MVSLYKILLKNIFAIIDSFSSVFIEYGRFSAVKLNFLWYNFVTKEGKLELFLFFVLRKNTFLKYLCIIFFIYKTAFYKIHLNTLIENPAFLNRALAQWRHHWHDFILQLIDLFILVPWLLDWLIYVKWSNSFTQP